MISAKNIILERAQKRINTRNNAIRENMDKNYLTESDTMQDSIICDRTQIRKLKQ